MALNIPIEETAIPGSTDAKIYWFEEFAGRQDVLRDWLQAISRMPSQHMPFICSVIVCQALPGRITSHGGSYGANWFDAWSAPRAIEATNVGADFLAQLRATSRLQRLIGIPVPKARIRNRSNFTLIHEIGHSVSHSLPLVPTGATVEDFPGVHYPRAPGNVEELATEAYARWVLRRSNIVWKDETRDSFHAVHPHVGLRSGETEIPADEVDSRYEAICRASLMRSRAMAGITPPT